MKSTIDSSIGFRTGTLSIIGLQDGSVVLRIEERLAPSPMLELEQRISVYSDSRCIASTVFGTQSDQRPTRQFFFTKSLDGQALANPIGFLNAVRFGLNQMALAAA
ncbi:hypothetical protein KW799_00505 [Candidatus Parcubacteria bacterium]|nr:hypothetical protein [Candidatus Parcubacteria bacterium]